MEQHWSAASRLQHRHRPFVTRCGLKQEEGGGRQGWTGQPRSKLRCESRCQDEGLFAGFLTFCVC